MDNTETSLVVWLLFATATMLMVFGMIANPRARWHIWMWGGLLVLLLLGGVWLGRLNGLHAWTH